MIFKRFVIGFDVFKWFELVVVGGLWAVIVVAMVVES